MRSLYEIIDDTEEGKSIFNWALPNFYLVNWVYFKLSPFWTPPENLLALRNSSTFRIQIKLICFDDSLNTPAENRKIG